MAKKDKTKVKPSRLSRYFSRFLVLVILVLVSLIVLKGNANLRNFIKEKVFNSNLNFASINEIYKKFFGSSLPLSDNTENTSTVAATKLEYSKTQKYKDGVQLTVKEKYAVPVMDSGLVIFAGEKEGYGTTIVIQRPDNVEVWYANLDNVNMSLYDYVKQGDIVGEAKEKTLYLVFTKDGKALDYKKYI